MQISHLISILVMLVGNHAATLDLEDDLPGLVARDGSGVANFTIDPPIKEK